MRRFGPYSPLSHAIPWVDHRRIASGIIVVVNNGCTDVMLPMHPQTHASIEHWHQTLKNRVLLKNHFLPGEVERQIDALVKHYHQERYYESLTT